MAYRCMKIVINYEKRLLANGEETKEGYELFKKDNIGKLDVFLACNRITQAQYQELYDMLA